MLGVLLIESRLASQEGLAAWITCYCNMFRPSNCHLQGVQLIHFQGQINKCVPDVKFILLSSVYCVTWQLHSGTHFVDLAVKMSYALKMALCGPKQFIVTQC